MGNCAFFCKATVAFAFCLLERDAISGVLHIYGWTEKGK
jgi:hypothetical protein